MKRRRFRNLKMVLIFLAVGALVLAVQPIETLAGKDKAAKDDNIPPPPSSADTAEGICDADNNGANIVDPDGDSDGDGVINLCECLGILPGTPCSSAGELVVEGYLSQSTDNPLNPVIKSVFVTLARNSDVNPGANSHIPWEPPEDATEAFGCLSGPPGEPGDTSGGLGANVIVVPYDVAETLPDRWVIANRLKLFWIEESLAYPSPNNSLGLCENSWGTPNNVGKCYVFTEQAIHDIEAKSPGEFVVDNLGGDIFGEVLKNQFINTICHESAHGAGKLRGIWVYEAGGYHHTVEDLVHDSQFVDHRIKKDTTTFYFGTGFPSTIDVDDFTPWEP